MRSLMRFGLAAIAFAVPSLSPTSQWKMWLVLLSRSGRSSTWSVFDENGRFIQDRNVVDDPAQSTFLSNFRKLESYRGDASLGTWLLAIAKNEALMHLREERQRWEREGSPVSSTLSR